MPARARRTAKVRRELVVTAPLTTPPAKNDQTVRFLKLHLDPWLSSFESLLDCPKTLKRLRQIVAESPDLGDVGKATKDHKV
jgi:hypothetical protein